MPFAPPWSHFTYGCRIRVVGDDDRNGGEKRFIFSTIFSTPFQTRFARTDRAGIVVAVRGADTDTHQLHFVAGPF